MDVQGYFQSLSGELEALKKRVRQFIDNQHWLTDGEWKEGVFGVGYTAVPGTVKRGQEYLRSDEQLERVVNKIIADI